MLPQPVVIRIAIMEQSTPRLAASATHRDMQVLVTHLMWGVWVYRPRNNAQAPTFVCVRCLGRCRADPLQLRHMRR